MTHDPIYGGTPYKSKGLFDTILVVQEIVVDGKTPRKRLRRD
jgi:hypothetical protein